MIFSRSPSDFWLRWNITVSAWLRDNVSMPLMLRFGRHVGQKPLLLLSFILMGLWHGFEMRWLLFGLYNGLIVVASLSLRRPNLDRVLVWILIIGNGILAHSFSEAGKIERSGWEILQEGFSLSVGLLALAWFLIESIEEWKNKSEWYLAAPIWSKGLMLILLGWGFCYALSMDMLANVDQQKLPIYFQL